MAKLVEINPFIKGEGAGDRGGGGGGGGGGGHSNYEEQYPNSTETILYQSPQKKNSGQVNICVRNSTYDCLDQCFN